MQLILALCSLIILFFAGCVSKPSDLKPHPAKDMILEIEREVLSQLKKEKNLYPCECGSGGKTPVTLLHWGLDYYQEADIEKARELLLTATNYFLDAINANQHIRSYLVSYPFKPESLEIRIFFFNPDGSLLPPEKLSIVSIKNGKLRYKTASRFPLATIYQETYEEAMAKFNTLCKT